MQGSTSNDTVQTPAHHCTIGKNKRPRKKRPLSSLDAAAAVHTITRLASGTLVRTLEPYLYTFATFARGRWVGRTILDVYTDEFSAYPESYYR
jgi:hypothetical protein